MATHYWNGHTIEVESRATPKHMWCTIAFLVRVDGGEEFSSPDRLEGPKSVVPFKVIDADGIRHGRLESGRVCSVLHTAYRVLVEDTEIAQGYVRAQNWYAPYGILAALGIGLLARLVAR